MEEYRAIIATQRSIFAVQLVIVMPFVRCRWHCHIRSERVEITDNQIRFVKNMKSDTQPDEPLFIAAHQD